MKYVNANYDEIFFKVLELIVNISFLVKEELIYTYIAFKQ